MKKIGLNGKVRRKGSKIATIVFSNPKRANKEFDNTLYEYILFQAKQVDRPVVYSDVRKLIPNSISKDGIMYVLNRATKEKVMKKTSTSWQQVKKGKKKQETWTFNG